MRERKRERQRDRERERERERQRDRETEREGDSESVGEITHMNREHYCFNDFINVMAGELGAAGHY